MCFIPAFNPVKHLERNAFKITLFSSGRQPFICLFLCNYFPSSGVINFNCGSLRQKSYHLLRKRKTQRTSLTRLSDIEHTSLATHFQDSSGSPVINPIPLWGSDVDRRASIRQIGTSGSDEPSRFTSGSSRNDDFESKDRKAKKNNHKLTKKKLSYEVYFQVEIEKA
ncbi:hypothetical protein OIU74_002043 [Salix koriyanagi]|uniref:Uncharacterized protein n=1 Tax=Salix koriyanagi TaxID=2511006 RepID=A0A9Q0X3F1_9ROSI|nr:hypothetical protein OIU74_002043 [Salix koriyanagi]